MGEEGVPRRPGGLAESLEHLLARATGILRAPGGLVPDEGEKRRAYWSAFFQATVHDAFGGINPGIQKWRDQYDRILTYLKSDPSLSSSATTVANAASDFDKVIYAAFQFWNADSDRITAFALNRRSEVFSDAIGRTNPDQAGIPELEQEWDNRWLTMREFNGQGRDGHESLRSIGNFVVNRVDHRTTAHIFHLRVGNARNWGRFRRFLEQQNSVTALPMSQKGLAEELDRLCSALGSDEDVLDIFDVPLQFVRSLFLAPLHFAGEESPSINGKTLWELLMKGEPLDQASLLEIMAKSPAVAEMIWVTPEGVATQKYLGCYLFWHYFREPNSKWILTADELKGILINNLSVCITSIIRNSVKGTGNPIISGQSQYCIPVWNNSTSYLYIVTKKPLSIKEMQAYRAFAEKLFYLSWTVDSNKKLEEDHKLLFLQATTNARAAILARNFSHSIGSHVLASPRFAQSLNPIYDIAGKAQRNVRHSLREAGQESGQSNLEDLVSAPLAPLSERDVREPRQLQSFLIFLQARFDYIAGSISDRRYIPNACLFLGDVLEPFLNQTVYLDHFVRDLGLSITDIEVLVHILPEDSEGLSTIKFHYAKDRLGIARLRRSQVRGTQKEVVVALPTSMSGRHAFYSFMENFVRNGLKYSGDERTSGSHYQIAMCWMEKAGKLGFYLWDNRSSPADTVRIIREFLGEDLVDPESLVFMGKGLGIKEMRLSALALTGANLDPRTPCLRLDIRPEEVAATENDAIGNYAPVYSFECKKPVYLALLGPNRRAGIVRSAPGFGEIVTMGARVLALDGGRVLHDPSVLQALLKHRRTLPYRTFAVCATDADASALTRRLREVMAGRLPVVVDREFAAAVSKLGQKARETVDEQIGQESWQQELTIRALELWLLAWKGTPPGGTGWHLAIGIETQIDLTSSAWGEYLCPASGKPRRKTWDSRLASVLVSADGGNQLLRSRSCDEKFLLAAEGKNSRYWQSERQADWNEKRTIIIDNHGKCFPASLDGLTGPGSGVPFRFYLELEGSENAELYEILASPPEDAFNFSIFILELLESSLFRFVVVDERVEQLLKAWQEKRTGSGHHSLERAGIFPAAFRVQSADGTMHMIGRGWHKGAPPSEDGARVVSLIEGATEAGQKIGLLPRNECDAVIIHEGLLDVVFSSPFPGLSPDCVFRQLSDGGVLVVTTSGRGSGSRYAESGSLFLEASALQSSLVATQNKLALFRYLANSVTVIGKG